MKIYRKFEDKWVYKHYNSVKDDELFIFNIYKEVGVNNRLNTRSNQI